MMNTPFKEVEKDFNLLKQEFKTKKISEQEYKDRLKKLRLKDTERRSWTIGAQSGKWYYFDGQNWKESLPPSIQKGKAICIYCGYENDLENESCTQCGGRFNEDEVTCPKCNTRLEDETQKCPYCDQKEKLSLRMEEKVLDPYEQEKGKLYVFRSINLLSFLFFWGTVGLVLGIIMGTLIGVAKRYVETIQYFPEFLKVLHGKLLGGVVFGFLGGVSGFILLAIAGLVLALLINVLLSFVGGIKVRITRTISDD
jgi:hypothetical protein